jgi:hypothetical protein
MGILEQFAKICFGQGCEEMLFMEKDLKVKMSLVKNRQTKLAHAAGRQKVFWATTRALGAIPKRQTSPRLPQGLVKKLDKQSELIHFKGILVLLPVLSLHVSLI